MNGTQSDGDPSGLQPGNAGDADAPTRLNELRHTLDAARTLEACARILDVPEAAILIDRAAQAIFRAACDEARCSPGEGQRSGEAVHGEHSPQAPVTDA